MIKSQVKEMPVKIIGGTNFSRDPKISDEFTQNLMVTASNEDQALVSYAGYKKRISFPLGQPRELYVSTRLNEMIAVIGNSVYAINTGVGYRLIGRLNSYSGEVYATENQ